MLGTVLLIILILLLIGAIPAWPYSSGLGIRPFGNSRRSESWVLLILALDGQNLKGPRHTEPISPTRAVDKAVR